MPLFLWPFPAFFFLSLSFSFSGKRKGPKEKVAIPAKQREPRWKYLCFYVRSRLSFRFLFFLLKEKEEKKKTPFQRKRGREQKISCDRSRLSLPPFLSRKKRRFFLERKVRGRAWGKDGFKACQCIPGASARVRRHGFLDSERCLIANIKRLP